MHFVCLNANDTAVLSIYVNAGVCIFEISDGCDYIIMFLREYVQPNCFTRVASLALYILENSFKFVSRLVANIRYIFPGNVNNNQQVCNVALSYPNIRDL